MLSQREFETSVRQLVDAFERKTVPSLSADEQRALKALRASFKRLQANPHLAAGDPNGAFTYEDPVLALIVQFLRQGPKAFGLAGKPGADLRKANIKWATIPIKVLFDLAGKAWEMLERRSFARAARDRGSPAPQRYHLENGEVFRRCLERDENGSWRRVEA